MNIPITASSVATGLGDQAAGIGSNSAGLDPDTFLQLLISQIKNQDPTKPIDSAELVQQLASFSQVQLSTETNARLSSITEALSLGQAAAIVGRGLVAADGEDLGIVEAARYTEEGVLARLANGREVLIDQTVTIRQ